jgi:hypothetical protein
VYHGEHGEHFPIPLSKHEDGFWNVIERTSGGPVEVEIDGHWVLLYRLPKEVAEEWSERLNERSRVFSDKRPRG